MKIKGLILLTIMTVTGLSFGQEKNECAEKLNFTGLYAQQKMWRDAANFFIEGYQICGLEGLKKADWNNAKIIYKNLIKAEKDPAAQKGLNDSLSWIYDNGDTYEVDADWKADFACHLVKNKSTESKKIDTLFANSIHSLKDKASFVQIQYYYTHLIRNYNDSDGEEKESARNFAIDEYLVLSDYVSTAKKTASEKYLKYWDKTQGILDQYFVKLADNCELLTEVLGKKLNSLPQDKVAKTAKVKGFLAILEKRKCDETDLYGQLADTLIVLEPTAEAYYAQANFFTKKGDNSKAKEYFQKSIELEGEGENKDKYTYGLATTYFNSGSYKAAFNTAKSVGGDYKGKAMMICAGAIAKTANSCGDTSFERKANYWLANDYVKKAISAGEKASSSSYLSNAPSESELFDAGISKGTSFTLKCWGESTTIR